MVRSRTGLGDGARHWPVWQNCLAKAGTQNRTWGCQELEGDGQRAGKECGTGNRGDGGTGEAMGG